MIGRSKRLAYISLPVNTQDVQQLLRMPCSLRIQPHSKIYYGFYSSGQKAWLVGL